MKIMFLTDGASPRQAINNVQPGEVYLMYADTARTKQVAQVCRDEQSYYVAGPRFNAAPYTLDQLVEVDAISHYNMGQADDRAHIYRVVTAAEAMDKLQGLFKLNKF